MSRRRAQLVALAVAASVIAAAVSLGGGELPSTAPPLPTDPREHAATVAADVPFPAGGNVNGIRWEERATAISRFEIAFVVRYNAACQWYRAAADRRHRTEAARVIATIPTWPGFVGTDVGRTAAEVGAALISGRPTKVARAVLADCRASHHREVAYARTLGLEPSA